MHSFFWRYEMILKLMIYALLGLSALFAVTFFKDALRHIKGKPKSNLAMFMLIGLITNFFDTLGIGSYATTTSIFKITGTVSDEQIPGTLNVGHCLPIVAEALIFMTVIEVDLMTLAAMILAAIIGAVWGAGIVSKLDVQHIRKGMGIALLGVGALMLIGLLGLSPTGGVLIGLTGVKLILAVVINFILGALMMIGVGLYAPCMALVFTLGMSPKVAFPIMMGSCAFLIPSASMRFIKEQSYHPVAALGLTLGGIPGVLIAAYVITSLPLKILKIVVLLVLVYTALNMLKKQDSNEVQAQS